MAKNGIFTEMDTCDIHAESGTFEVRFEKRKYENDVIVKRLGFIRSSVPQPVSIDDPRFGDATLKEKQDTIAHQQSEVDTLMGLLSTVQQDQETDLKAEETMFVEQKALRETMKADKEALKATKQAELDIQMENKLEEIRLEDLDKKAKREADFAKAKADADARLAEEVAKQVADALAKKGDK